MNLHPSNISPESALSERGGDCGKVWAFASANISDGDIVAISGEQDGHFAVAPAFGEAAPALTNGKLFVCSPGLASGAFGVVRPWAVLTGQDTSAAAVGDKVYLADASVDKGGYSLTPTDSNIVVGHVLSSDATAGRVFLEPMAHRGDSSQFKKVTLTTLQVKALNATPVTLVSAPGAGKAIIVEEIVWFLDYATTAYAADAGENLTAIYETSTAQVVDAITGDGASGFAEVTADATAWAPGKGVILAENEAVQAHILSGEWITGDSPIVASIKYRIVSV